MSGCQTLREVSNLRQVDFRLDRVSDARLAGVSLRNVDSYDDIGAADMLRLSSAIADGQMPLAFTVHVAAQNPSENGQNARLTELDWRLFLDDKETIAGKFDREVVIPPGEPTDIPISMELDLVDFFDGNLREIVNLALALGGEGEPTNVKLRARPTIQTAIGPIRYPNEIMIVNEDVNSETVDR
ncbi:LEA type 2 family protein [Longibacter sp.]|uniref:LEA type 2 family protein n=1 Tax=Longibacter sp. TaxID=2045415 RepID=UPI003EBC6BB5